MNSLVPYELIVQGVLVFVVLLNWIFSFSSLKLFVLIIMGTHLAVQGIRSLSSPHAPARALSQEERERVRCSGRHLHCAPPQIDHVRAQCSFADKKIVDASRIWDRTHKNEVQRQIIIGLVFAGVAFFCLLYNLVCRLSAVRLLCVRACSNAPGVLQVAALTHVKR